MHLTLYLISAQLLTSVYQVNIGEPTDVALKFMLKTKENQAEWEIVKHISSFVADSMLYITLYRLLVP